MKAIMRIGSLLAASLMLLVSCVSDPFMDGPYRPGNGSGTIPGGGGGSTPGGGGGETPGLSFTVNPNWTVSYNGREFYEGAEVDRIVVKSTDTQHYYIDVITKASFQDDFKNDVASYAQSLHDNLAADVKDGNAQWSDLLGTRESYILFDRLRAGEWKAFAVGFTSSGELTGKYAVLDFPVAEEKPTAAFNDWLGTWKISGMDLEGNKVAYTITLRSSESNYAYWLSGWEPAQSEDETNYEFEVFFNKENHHLEFNSLYFETVKFDDGEYEVCLNGNYKYNGKYYYVNEDIALADGIISDDGKSAQVIGCGLTLEMQGGQTFETQFTSMQMMYVPVAEGGTTYVFNTNVPQFPLTMEWISASTDTPQTKAAGTRLSAPRKARRHEAARVVRHVAPNPNQAR